MKTALNFIVLVVSSTLCLGIPQKDGRLTIPHTLIDLNESQVAEMETLDTVTLTSAQWQMIRKVSPGTPKRLVGILPITWDDCLCCIDGGVGAILTADGRLAVWHEKLNVSNLGAILNKGRHLVIHMDGRGQCYHKGVLVPFDEMIAAIRASRPVSPKQKKVEFGDDATIKIPPGRSPKEPVFAERLKQLQTELASKGWRCYRPTPQATE